jgi:hypothetical protein
VTPSELSQDIQAFITRGSGDFETLALRVFAYQYEHNLPYRRFCDGSGKSPKTVHFWHEIPAAPASAFKHFDLTCVPPEICIPEHGGRVFHSSGTTGRDTSKHYMDALALACYRASLHTGYRRFTGWASNDTAYQAQGGLPVVALVPHPNDALHSSLAFMCGELVDELGQGFYFAEGWQSALTDLFRTHQLPFTLFGTAFAFVHFFDTVDEYFTLPEGTIVIETGGFKGRSREIPRDELYQLFTERLGVPPDHCMAEYGMSEMASQFYSIAAQPKLAPPWVRTRVMNPITGVESPVGEPGLLAHYDLANLNSVLAIQTEDMGIVAESGEGFTLLGRAPGAVLRGCSLTAEAFFAPSESQIM